MEAFSYKLRKNHQNASIKKKHTNTHFVSMKPCENFLQKNTELIKIVTKLFFLNMIQISKNKTQNDKKNNTKEKIMSEILIKKKSPPKIHQTLVFLNIAFPDANNVFSQRIAVLSLPNISV